MTTTVRDSIPVFPRPSPIVWRVRPDQPWLWLAAGWRDFLRAPRASVIYGGAITAISFGIVVALDRIDRLALLFPLLAGFALVCPFLAVGLYAISRALSLGEPVNGATVVAAIRRNRDQIALMGVFLMLIHIAWVRIATLLFVLFFARIPVALSELINLLLRTPSGFAFLLVGTVIGALLAAFTFAVSVVALPMLVDSEVGVISAVATSWTAAAANRTPMALWAVIIAGATLFSFATGFLALIVVMPLLGYASWHAYCDLVTPPEPDAPVLSDPPSEESR